MQDKKYILKRTISFITSVSILSCYYSVPLSAAAADTSAAASETEQTSVTTTADTTVTTATTTETSTSTTKAEYTYTVHIGDMEIDKKNEADKFYGSLFTTDMKPDKNGKITTTMTPEELEKLINQNNIIDYSNRHYKFTEISNYSIKLDQYFKVEMNQDVPVSFTDEFIHDNDTYLKKNSDVTLTADQD